MTHKMVRPLILFQLVLLISPLAAQAKDCSDAYVGEFVRRFYVVGGHPSSVPSLIQLQEGNGGPFSIKLHGLLVSAAKYRDKFISTHPPEPSGDGEPPIIYKPPFVDGDIFRGSPDGAAQFAVRNVRSLKKGRWDVRLKSAPDTNMSPWAVSVIVVRERKRCAIDDVRYEPLSEGVTLSKWLSTRW